MSTSKRRSVFQLSVSLLAWCAGIAAGAEKKRDEFSTKPSMELPASVDSTTLRRVTDTNDYWMIEAAVNGQPVVLAIDTGSHQTFLGPRAAVRLDLKDTKGIAFTRKRRAAGEGTRALTACARRARSAPHVHQQATHRPQVRLRHPRQYARERAG